MNPTEEEFYFFLYRIVFLCRFSPIPSDPAWALECDFNECFDVVNAYMPAWDWGFAR